MEQAEAVDQQEDHNYGSDKTGDEITEDICDRQKRAEKVKVVEQRQIDAYIPDREYQAQQRDKAVDNFHKDSFVYDDDRDCYVCVEGQDLPFSQLQKHKNKEPLRIYRGRNCSV